MANGSFPGAPGRYASRASSILAGTTVYITQTGESEMAASTYQQNMTVNDLIAHLHKVAAAGHGDKPVLISVYALPATADLDARPDYPRAESAGVGRVTVRQMSGPRLDVVAETW